MDVTNWEALSSPEHSDIRFGDNSEFVLESFVQQFDGTGQRVVEANLFFRHGGVLRGLTLVTAQEDTEAAEPNIEAPTTIELPVIDPEAVLEILQLPSDTLKNISRPVDDVSSA